MMEVYLVKRNHLIRMPPFFGAEKNVEKQKRKAKPFSLSGMRILKSNWIQNICNKFLTFIIEQIGDFVGEVLH
jgi:hypothetical protein